MKLFLGKVIIFISIATITGIVVLMIGTKLNRWINKERIETELDNLEYEELKRRIKRGE